jgi:hypothetical protein
MSLALAHEVGRPYLGDRQYRFALEDGLRAALLFHRSRPEAAQALDALREHGLGSREFRQCLELFDAAVGTLPVVLLSSEEWSKDRANQGSRTWR